MSDIFTVSSKQPISLSVSFLVYFIFQQFRFQLTETVQFQFYVYTYASRMFAREATGTCIPVCTFQFYDVDRKRETDATPNMRSMMEAKNAVGYRMS